MAGVTLVCLALGWLIARAMRLDAPQMGAVVLATGFGSSSMLGFALVGEVFPGDDAAVAEAAILSGLGVQPALFTLGTMIAISYGQQEASAYERLRASHAYFRSPIFCAFVSGLVLSVILGNAITPFSTASSTASTFWARRTRSWSF